MQQISFGSQHTGSHLSDGQVGHGIGHGNGQGTGPHGGGHGQGHGQGFGHGGGQHGPQGGGHGQGSGHGHGHGPHGGGHGGGHFGGQLNTNTFLQHSSGHGGGQHFVLFFLLPHVLQRNVGFVKPESVSLSFNSLFTNELSLLLSSLLSSDSSAFWNHEFLLPCKF